MIDSWLPGVTTFTTGALKAQIRENSTLRVCVSSESLPLSSPSCDMWSPGISHRLNNHKHTSAPLGPARPDRRAGPRTGQRTGSCQSNPTDSSLVCVCLFVFASFTSLTRINLNTQNKTQVRVVGLSDTEVKTGDRTTPCRPGPHAHGEVRLPGFKHKDESYVHDSDSL